MANEELDLEAVNIEEVIENYNSSNIIKKAETKVTKELGATIKTYFSKNGITNFTAKTCEAVVSVVTSEVYDDDKLLDIIKTLEPELVNQLVKTKEYIDETVFEKLVLEGQLELSTFNNALITKTTEKLTIKKLKEKK